MESEKTAPSSSVIDGINGREYSGTDNTFDIYNQSSRFYLIALLVSLCVGLIYVIIDACVTMHRARKRDSSSATQQSVAQPTRRSSRGPNSSTIRQNGDSEARKWPRIRDLMNRSSSTPHTADVEMQVPETALRQPEPQRNGSSFMLLASPAHEERLERLLAARFRQQAYAGLGDSTATTGTESTDPSVPQTDSPAIPDPVALRGGRHEDFETGPPPTYASHQYDEIATDVLPDQEPPVYGSAITHEEAVTARCRLEAERIRMSIMHGPLPSTLRHQ
jgi:hypothetical protein